MRAHTGGYLGHIKIVNHRIELLLGSRPVHQHRRRKGPKQQAQEKKENQHMLASTVIKLSQTKWA